MTAGKETYVTAKDKYVDQQVRFVEVGRVLMFRNTLVFFGSAIVRLSVKGNIRQAGSACRE